MRNWGGGGRVAVTLFIAAEEHRTALLLEKGRQSQQTRQQLGLTVYSNVDIIGIFPSISL